MTETTRREFLKQLAAGSVMALGGLPALADEKVQLELGIARWKVDPLPAEQLGDIARRLTEQALASIGGMSRFVGKGDEVWIKPNMGWNRAPAQAANTNPDVVATLTRLCLEAGAKRVKVGDNTCHQPSQCYSRSGIAAAAAAAGAEIVTLDARRFKRMKIGGDRLDEWELYPEIIEADLVINAPLVKHHGLSNATLCMKNYMGVVGGRRDAWHQDLPACLVDITRFMKPRLCVLDAVRILTDHGPQGGNLEDVEILGAVAAGTDIVALDAFGAELMGKTLESVPSIGAAEAAGLGNADYRKLPHEVVELS